MTDNGTQQIHQFLDTLNAAQRQAVQYSPKKPLQILAGPGSGKTKVLTSRIAHLILHHAMSPTSICAVTFTNKAANEMKERLIRLIGKEKTSLLRMGTFHSLCTLFLRKYAKVVGLEDNFAICDAEESKKMISGLLKAYKSFLEAKDITLRDSAVLSFISKAKSKGQSAAEVLSQIRAEHENKENKENEPLFSAKTVTNDIDRIMAEVYAAYDRALRKSNCLDFDDLLLYGVQLFNQHKKATNWCKHVLVDEFQDTNAMQYELMKSIALAAGNCVTVVGDPDQSSESIFFYGWRSAEVANLSKMQKDFPAAQQILLEENYRSTASILKLSLAIVAQDKGRLPKSLRTSHPMGTTPVLVSFPSEQEEAAFIALELKRVAAHMGGILNWGDFAILLRFNALSRTLESALQKEGVPNRVLGGQKFFERLEIKDLLAYLQVTDNPKYVNSFERAISVPSRGIGEKTLTEIMSRADKTKLSPLEVLERIHDGKAPDIKPPVKRKIGSFIPAVRTLRTLADQGTSPADLIRRLLDLIDYESHLKKTQTDWESRWENVQELISFANEVDSNLVSWPLSPAHQEESIDTPLRSFLQASMLSSEGDNQSEEDGKQKVTISTCHAAKGLEWPVVFVPAVEQGTFPFYRSEDVEEERRLLYVACTRSQTLLYLSHSTKRNVGGETKQKQLSDFIRGVVEQQSLFADRAPDFLPADRAVISKVLRRTIPDKSEVTRMVTEFNRTVRHKLPIPGIPVFGHPGLMHNLASTNTGFGNVHEVQEGFKTAKGAAAAVPQPTWAPPNVVARPGTRTKLTRTLNGSKGSIDLSGSTMCTSSSDANRSDAHMATVHAAIPMVAGTAGNVGAKRRLGMGRSNTGYANKKFKLPT